MNISRLFPATGGDRSRRRWRRRLASGVMLLVALAIAGTAAAVFTPRAQVAQADESNAALKLGKQLFDTSCVSCHGANLQGVPERGPSLIGVGEAAVYFQVSTGRMPDMSLNSQAPSKAPAFTENQIDALGAYVQANGGGPERPINPDGSLKSNEQLRDGSIARGGDLFRLNCASCHNFTGKGGALSSGKYAPGLTDANPTEIYTAMLTGPQNMPKFSDRQPPSRSKPRSATQ